MNKFKKILKWQLILLPIIGFIIIIIGSVIHNLNRNSHKELSKEAFTQLVIDNEITAFGKTRRGMRFEVEVSNGEKYFYEFNSYSEMNDFKELVSSSFGAFGTRKVFSLIEFIPIIIASIIAILLFNVVVILWFVAFYDLLKSEFIESQNKIIWFLTFIFLFLIAPIFYMFISPKQKR